MTDFFQCHVRRRGSKCLSMFLRKNLRPRLPQWKTRVTFTRIDVTIDRTSQKPHDKSHTCCFFDRDGVLQTCLMSPQIIKFGCFTNIHIKISVTNELLTHFDTSDVQGQTRENIMLTYRSREHGKTCHHD